MSHLERLLESLEHSLGNASSDTRVAGSRADPESEAGSILDGPCCL